MRDLILARTNNGLSVFRHYIRGRWRERQKIYNPLYDDTNASCVIKQNNEGRYIMVDYGNMEYSGDCFFLVGKLNGLDDDRDFVEIMKIIDRDLSLGLYDNNPPPIKRRAKQSIKEVKAKDMQLNQPQQKRYRVEPREYNSQEIAFWAEYGVSRDTLHRYNVVALSKFESVNSKGEQFVIRSTQNEPIFGYLHKTFVKIYRPYSTLRFLYGGVIGESYCFGLDQLPAKGDVLYITGGEKDVLTLSARGFNAICFNSETAQIPHEIIKRLSFMFKHIVLLYDVDKTGLAESQREQKQLSEFNVKRLLLPLPGTKQAKDISDYFKMGNSIERFKTLFIEMLDNLYSNTVSILKSCEVNVNNPPLEAQMVVSINDVPLGTEGNLLCVTGGEGTGKSNFVGAIISGCINCDDATIDTLGVTIAPNSENRAVLLYDTEQSEVQLYKNSRNIIRRAKLNSMPDSFKAYSLTSLSRRVRLQSIVESMDRFFHLYDGIHLVIIDGIADLVQGANNEVESIAVVEELYRLAGIYNTCILCVLHYIPNGIKLRGHLGSELQRKSATIISIERDRDPAISVVKAIKVRDGSPLDVPILQFSWSRCRAMHTFVGEKPKEERESRKESELLSIAQEIFSHCEHITYGDLCSKIQQLFDVKERTAKSYIKYMRERDIISNDPANSSYLTLTQ